MDGFAGVIKIIYWFVKLTGVTTLSHTFKTILFYLEIGKPEPIIVTLTPPFVPPFLGDKDDIVRGIFFFVALLVEAYPIP